MLTLQKYKRCLLLVFLLCFYFFKKYVRFLDIISLRRYCSVISPRENENGIASLFFAHISYPLVYQAISQRRSLLLSFFFFSPFPSPLFFPKGFFYTAALFLLFLLYFLLSFLQWEKEGGGSENDFGEIVVMVKGPGLVHASLPCQGGMCFLKEKGGISLSRSLPPKLRLVDTFFCRIFKPLLLSP